MQLLDAMNKALRETQTLHAGSSKAEPKFFAPLQAPFPGAQDGQILITFTYKPSLVRIFLSVLTAIFQVKLGFFLFLL